MLRILFLAGLIVATPAAAQERARLDDLFARLQESRDAEDAAPIVKEIQDIWSDGPTDTIDYLVVRLNKAFAAEDWDAVIALSDRIIGLEPGYAGGWFYRAQALNRQDKQAEAAGDYARALLAEPRHYPSFIGLGFIFMADGDPRRAYEAFHAALAINPHIEGVDQIVRRLRLEAIGRPA